MSDLIERQAAVDKSLTFFIEYLGGAFDEDGQRLLAQKMNLLPSAEPIHVKWIPVSEMLPGPSRRLFLVSGYTMIDDLKVLGIDMARWNGDEWTFSGDPRPNIVVLAWMPLPEPYREVEE